VLSPAVAPFVDPAFLAAHPHAVVADVRSSPTSPSEGARRYAEEHLPGAVFLDLDRWLAGPPSPEQGRHPLPEPEVFAEGMRAAGIGDDSLVVAYDDEANAFAARLVWMLRVTGHAAALLDGGITGWTGPTTREVPVARRAEFTVTPWPAEELATMDEVTDTLLLDARPAGRFRGEDETLDVRAGHVPGAVNLPCRENVGPDGFLLPDHVLRERFAAVDRPWVSSCGSGVTACQNLLVAERLGLPTGRLWPGSWSQWAATDRPAALGA
jgi:thiosulfate/3-mercaptopyruvate sulfurtransferase